MPCESVRVKHAANLEYLDANYGGVLMIFDRLFGTYLPERRDLPCRYGWVQPLTSNNVFVIVFHQWVKLWSDLRGARNLGDALGYLWRPPGWVPQGEGMTTAEMRARALADGKTSRLEPLGAAGAGTNSDQGHGRKSMV